MTTLEDFLRGVPLQYRGFKHRCTATVVSPTKVAVENHKTKKIEFATIEEGTATALYYNLTR